MRLRTRHAAAQMSICELRRHGPAKSGAASICFPLALGALLSAQVALAQPAVPSTQPNLSLRDALRLALAQNPSLRARAWDLSRADGRARQAGTRPNPALGLDLENIGGTGSLGRSSEATVSIGQLLELGGKRAARSEAARSDRSVISSDVELQRLEVAAATAARFHDLLALESASRLAEEELRAAEEAMSTTAVRVRSGAAPAVEERRAQVELANTRLDRVLTTERLSVARTRLASMWGAPEAAFGALEGQFELLPSIPNLDSLLGGLNSSPGVSRWKQEIEARRGRLAVERSRSLPDLGLAAGVRSLGDGSGRALVAGVSVPLPLFDRNHGAIQEASAAVSQSEDELASARAMFRSEVIEAHSAVVRSHRRLAALRQEVLPVASQAFDEMRDGFERGRFSYLDLLEARRTWIRARREDIQALLELRLATTELARLTAVSVVDFSDRIGGQP